MSTSGFAAGLLVNLILGRVELRSSCQGREGVQREESLAQARRVDRAVEIRVRSALCGTVGKTCRMPFQPYVTMKQMSI